MWTKLMDAMQMLSKEGVSISIASSWDYLTLTLLYECRENLSQRMLPCFDGFLDHAGNMGKQTWSSARSC